jgi:hypothetical protein
MILDEICVSLVEIYESCVGFWALGAAVGLDKLRVLCYTGKGCYKNQHSHQLT